MLRQPLKAFLEREGLAVVAETSDGREVLELAREHRPDLAVLDAALSHLNGFKAARELHHTCPSIGVILLAMPDQVRDALAVLHHGVRGLLLKTQPIDDLLVAAREVRRGGIYVGPVVSNAAYLTRGLSEGDILSSREREVIELVAQGKSTKQIAAILGISVKTAGFHRDRLMKKLHIHETAGLVRYAIRHGIVAP